MIKPIGNPRRNVLPTFQVIGVQIKIVADIIQIIYRHAGRTALKAGFWSTQY